MPKDIVDTLMDGLDTFLNSIFDERWLGRRGEKLTERELKWVSLFGRKGKILRNVYIPKEDGQTSEIDVLFITQKGIFVFESKNYSGWIFGDEKGLKWTVTLPNRQKHSFYNPILQNRTHLKWLGKYIGESIPLFSIIVFSERCELKKISVESPDVRVIKRDKTYVTVREIWEKAADVLPEEAIDELYEKLKNLTNVDKAAKTAHIENIEKRYKKTETASVPAAEQPSGQSGTDPEEPPDTKDEQKEVSSQENLLCPRCGKPLVLRTAKRGERAGMQFYGCSGFPACRFTRDLP